MDPIKSISFRDFPEPTQIHLIKYDYSTPEKREEYESSRPVLDLPNAPSKPFFTSLASFVETLSSIEHLYLDVLDQRLQDENRKHLVNFEKSFKQSRELDSEIKTHDWYGVLENIASYLIAAISMIMGAGLIANGTSFLEYGTGGALIVSGVSTILGSSLKNAHANPELAAILTTIGSAVGLLGSAGVALFSTVATQETAGKIVIAAISILAHASETIKEAHATNISHLKAKNLLINQVFENQQETMKMVLSDAEFFAERMSETITLCSHIQRKQEQSIRKILSIQEYAG